MELGAVATFGVLAISVAQAFLPVPQVEWGFAFAKRGNERMRWVDFAAWRDVAVGTFGHGPAHRCGKKRKSEKNDVALRAKYLRSRRVATCGTGRNACATETQRQLRRPEASGTKGNGKKHACAKHCDLRCSVTLAQAEAYAT